MSMWLDNDPVIIERANGAWLTDTRGKKYLDGVSSLWVNVHGHRHPVIDETVQHQLKHLAHSTLLGLSNIPSIELAARLAEITPGALTKVFYSDNGSTAVEVALKMAYQYWQIKGHTERREFVALENAYHGDTIGSVSLGGIQRFHDLFRPLLFPVHRAPSPYWYRCPEGDNPRTCVEYCLGQLEQLFKAREGRIAAMVIEPVVQGAAGMIVHPPGYLRQVHALCREHHVLLICDEVATGFGRTGTLFACQHEGVEPDFMALAKGLTGGYLPVAATLASEQVFDTFKGSEPSVHTFFHGHTYTGNPLGCAAALACLDVFEQERVIETIQPRVALLEKLLGSQIAPLRHCGQVRQKGFMVGIELVKDRATKEPFPPSDLTGARVCMEVRRSGVILRPLGDVVVLMPPLCIVETEVELLVAATRQAIETVTEGAG
jgi:adenosylmethionine-8-amino-7-oxononanoate aminotransferase